ncbi:thiamine biosynthesis protein ThiI [Hydrogenoanaerobacterium saccharovorans]|uniref:Probable tRNA sulfurtransferase n=1 Tax=Hydrogenoanaerobacterium saccharovorans TaxID=474960 RepID=A0A1H8BRF6_9FIRM|nr:tRNA uracil 4-sulfurtransferase ThiI [Hydrogenoanaerobacterium saccharovorans]RPF47270.1 thiamine biosynthesis protein ThiI [Hydrogenoanaerobacterium saccharovorans]SEM85471.1 thiamine biosynthesis protein ThiI [Hydrogenoanaerobacterium saccharovorans]
MKEIILLKSGEIALKGLNRGSFEDVLIKNARRRLASLGSFKFTKAQSTIYCKPASDDLDLDEAVERLSKVFGFSALSRAAVVEKDWDDIKTKAVEYLADTLPYVNTFKVMARRSDKTFPMNSPQICAELGGILLEAFPNLTVDVKSPEMVVWVEVREVAAYIHARQLPGAGGLPIGTSGKAALLVSGGIDSPVAGYMMAKRGIELSAIHFFSPPYTSERAKLKVISLLEKVSAYAGRIKLHVVPFTEIQEQIQEHCPEELFTIIMRRYMMKISQRIAEANEYSALITGESVAQVASQTIAAIACTDAVCDIPVFRPVIGMDKEEIVQISRKIDTFETSILPFEDCCTVFTPKHPRTKPKLRFVEEAEVALDEETLIQNAIDNIEEQIIQI